MTFNDPLPLRLMSASESENDDPDSHLYLNQNQMVNEIGLDHERIRQVVDSVFRNIEQEQSQETRNRSKKTTSGFIFQPEVENTQRTIVA